MKKLIVIGVIILFLGLAIAPSISSNTAEVISFKEKKNTTVKTTSFDSVNLKGNLSGYVTDLLMRPIEGARVRVSFHGTYEEDYTDATGYYHVTNISICWCLKDAAASKVGYKTKSVSLVIRQNTTYDFVLRPRIFYILWRFLTENYIPSQKIK